MCGFLSCKCVGEYKVLESKMLRNDKKKASVFFILDNFF